MRLRGTFEKDKLPLKSSPLVVEFEYGKQNEGYWTYDHMVEQLENTVDVLKVLMRKEDVEYEIVFYIGESQNHNKKKSGGLNVVRTNQNFGGAQPKMQDSLLVKGCIGPYPNSIDSFYKAIEVHLSTSIADKHVCQADYSSYYDGQSSQAVSLEIGDIHSMVFTESDEGPFWLSMEERKNRKYSKPTGRTVTKKKNMKQLRSDLTKMCIKYW